MTSDINGTVVAIQGVAVSSTTPTDGYVLTYVAADSEWEPKPVSAGTIDGYVYFTSSGTWTCPAGVTSVLCIGAGGGGGGSGGWCRQDGSVGFGGGGGGAAIQQTQYVITTPGTNYSITIGAGGSGGNGGSGVSDEPGNPGSDGSPTKMTYSSTNYFYTLGGGGGGSSAFGGDPNWASGTPFAGTISNGGWIASSYGNYYSLLPILPGAGGNAANNNGVVNTQAGMMNFIGGYSGGSAGSNGYTSSFGGGGGGGAGPQGVGGNGGNGSTTNGVAGSNGSNASINTAAGGGGGGGGYYSSGGNGGAGGSGYLYIVY
jgi:hypothetical protein